MTMPWERKKEDNDEGSDKFKELMDQINSSKTESAETKTKLAGIESKLSVLDDVALFIKEQKDARAAAAAEEARRKIETHREEEDENLGSDLLTDPRSTINRVTASQRESIARIRAKQVLGEVFNDPDNQDKFKYYSGEIRKQVDALIASQSLDFQINPLSVENAYDTIVGKNMAAIMEGKIKTRFASSSGGSSSSGNSGGSGSGSDEKIVITDKLRKAAKLVGFEGKEEEYAKMVIAEQEGEEM